MYCNLVKLTGDKDTGMFAFTWDPWRNPVIAKAEFPDGKIRTVRLNQSADSYFSWPGRTSWKRFTVTCFVTNEDGRIMGHYNTSSLQEAMGRE